MREYSSKEEIYEDYDVVIKFRLRFDVSRDFYSHMYSVLSELDECRVKHFERDVRLLRGQFPGRAIGAFVEVPISDDRGSIHGTRSILLGHESGPEWWIESAITTGAGLTLKILWDIIKDRTIHSLNTWLIDRGYNDNPILYVEIRTQHKGVMRIEVADLKSQHLQCLAAKFDEVEHISLLNRKCFGGHLFESVPGYDDDGI